MIRKLKISLLKFLVKTVGMTSTGIRMSFEYGFTSGKMLDYIYMNKPSGKYIIGYIIDKLYLSHRGWKVIRERKRNLEKLIEQAISRIPESDKPIRMLDVASAQAQYIIDVLGRNADKNIHTLCRDYDDRWVQEGRTKAESAGVANITFQQGDAFDHKSFESLNESQDIVISSGFYDWITNDELIKKSISIISSVLKKNGYFIFTNQSGHFDLEMVSQIFVDFNNKPLQMTVRSAELMNGWIREAGFEIITTISDKWDYYSVTIAHKI